MCFQGRLIKQNIMGKIDDWIDRMNEKHGLPDPEEQTQIENIIDLLPVEELKTQEEKKLWIGVAIAAAGNSATIDLEHPAFIADQTLIRFRKKFYSETEKLMETSRKEE